MSERQSTSQIEALGTVQDDERILWEGRPDLALLARSAFHTRAVLAYFALVAVPSIAFGSMTGIALTALGAVVALGLLYGFAWLCARTTRYVLTDRRLILNIGMAIEKSVNLPLKRIGAAHLHDRGKGFGDIAIEPVSGHPLSYAMLWPHARAWHVSRPQPMLRAIADVAEVARLLAEATAQHREIARAELPGTTQTAGGMTEALA